MFGRLSRLFKDHQPEYVVDASVANLASLPALLGRWGAVQLRSCFAPEHLRSIRAAADDIYAGRDAFIAAGGVPSEAERRRYLRRTIPLDEISVGGKTATEILASPIFFDVARAYLRREPECAPNSFVRLLVPGADIQALPFHQDQTILERPLLNAWIPLSECGVRAPGLELVLTSGRKLLKVAGPPDSYIPVERARIDEAAVLAEFGAGTLWRPVCVPGDALVFTGATVHRTHVTPAMTEPRLSCELRLV
jgi:hypothetical protein